jgi:hypothetical protein
MSFLRSVVDAVLDRTPQELIEAVLVAVAVAFLMAGLYELGRRRSLHSPTFVGSLAFASGVLGMLLAAGYLTHVGPPRGRRRSFATLPPLPGWPPTEMGRVTPPGSRSFPGPAWSSGFHVLMAADENRDGLLNVEEIERMVRDADKDGDGSIDSQDIDRLIRSRVRPPGSSPPMKGNRAKVREAGDGQSRAAPAASTGEEL